MAIPRITVPLVPIGLPLERLKVRKVIGAAQRGRLDMVDLPSELGIVVAVVRETQDRTADIGSPEKRI